MKEIFDLIAEIVVADPLTAVLTIAGFIVVAIFTIGMCEKDLPAKGHDPFFWWKCH